MKNDAKTTPKSHHKSVKIAHVGTLGLIFSVFYRFWEDSKNQCFLMSLWVVEKSEKSSLGGPRVVKVAPTRCQGSGEWGFEGPRGGLAHAPF